MRTTTAPKQPVLLSSDTSDSDTEEESIFGPRPSRRKPGKKQPSQRSSVNPFADTNKPCEPQIRRGSDRELQAFISMRDQADTATEVRDSVSLHIKCAMSKGNNTHKHIEKNSRITVSICI